MLSWMSERLSVLESWLKLLPWGTGVRLETESIPVRGLEPLFLRSIGHYRERCKAKFTQITFDEPSVHSAESFDELYELLCKYC